MGENPILFFLAKKDLLFSLGNPICGFEEKIAALEKKLNLWFLQKHYLWGSQKKTDFAVLTKKKLWFWLKTIFAFLVGPQFYYFGGNSFFYFGKSSDFAVLIEKSDFAILTGKHN